MSRELHADPADSNRTTEERFETVDAVEPIREPSGPAGAPPKIAKLGHVFDTHEQIGEGAMSRVYSVFDRSLRRRCAMKVLVPQLEKDPRECLRFMEEAQITGQLDHPNIVTIHALGTLESGAVCFTMKLIDGVTLREKLKPYRGVVRRPDWLAEYLQVFVDVCDALSFAHDRGVIHRDLKPDNVIVGPFGQVFLMDWGVAGVRAREGTVHVQRATGLEGVDREGMVVGTIDFMAPEQARGELSRVDERSDIYALGALLYFILAGRAPCEHVDRRTRLAAVQRGEVEPLDSLSVCAHVPRGLRAIAMRALSSSPGDRYQTVTDLKNDVLRYARGAPELPVRSFPKGSQVVREGETNAEAFIVREGTCQAYKTIDGERVVLRTMGPGEVFGELSILSDKPCTATVEALEDLTLEIVEASTLRDGVGLHTWLAPFIGALAERFREVDARLTALEHAKKRG